MKNENGANSAPSDILLNDQQVSEIVNLSVAWVRKQRYLRKKSEPHSFTVDAINVGNVPRYKMSQIQQWLGNLQNISKEIKKDAGQA